MLLNQAQKVQHHEDRAKVGATIMNTLNVFQNEDFPLRSRRKLKIHPKLVQRSQNVLRLKVVCIMCQKPPRAVFSKWRECLFEMKGKIYSLHARTPDWLLPGIVPSVPLFSFRKTNSSIFFFSQLIFFEAQLHVNPLVGIVPRQGCGFKLKEGMCCKHHTHDKTHSLHFKKRILRFLHNSFFQVQQIPLSMRQLWLLYRASQYAILVKLSVRDGHPRIFPISEMIVRNLSIWPPKRHVSVVSSFQWEYRVNKWF